MNRLLNIGTTILLIAVGIGFLVTDDGVVSILVIGLMSLLVIEISRRYSDDKNFITWIFLGALAARLVFGLVVHTYDLREFFGGDAFTYDFRASVLVSRWFGDARVLDPELENALQARGSGWGMHYLVAVLYTIFGRNMLAAQSFCAVIGAATAPMSYFCARKVFQNVRVGKNVAFLVAFFPSFVIWSAQLLKDGLIIFLLVLTVTLVLELQERISYKSVVLLGLSLSAVFTLRFYIFYMLATAVLGSFLVGTSNSMRSIARRTVVLLVIGVSLTYFGVERLASVELEKWTNLDRLQRSREDLSRAKSGFGKDVDVSSTEGAVTVLPVGFAYLMFAPFPWQMSNFRQLITLPEVLLWWAMMPLLGYGLWFTFRNRLRPAFPVLIFSLMLTFAYSMFLGNVGTAYRQRTQIQVFLFMFIAVGIELIRERREDKKLRRIAMERRNRAIQVGIA